MFNVSPGIHTQPKKALSALLVVSFAPFFKTTSNKDPMVKQHRRSLSNRPRLPLSESIFDPSQRFFVSFGSSGRKDRALHSTKPRSSCRSISTLARVLARIDNGFEMDKRLFRSGRNDFCTCHRLIGISQHPSSILTTVDGEGRWC